VITEKTMSALGRHSLFHILNPAKQARLVVEYTASLNADMNNCIPPASIIGDSRTMLTVAGRGSARIFSPPIEPQTIAGGAYIALDMGTQGNLFPDRRSGIMTLYGMDIPMDPRRIVGFVRDISLISAEAYSGLRPPQQLQEFPRDLANRDLEYSGIYEDGWVGESSSVVLSQPEGPSSLVVRATVPLLQSGAAASQLKVLVDGSEVADRSVGGGEMDLKIPVPLGSGRRRIRLLFDHAEHLPAPDNRPASTLVKFIGFQKAAAVPGH
jgi:hypothetical protein